MKILLILVLFAPPFLAYTDPWDDCWRWNEDTASVVLCRKAKMGQWKYEQQRRLEEQELPPWPPPKLGGTEEGTGKGREK